MQLVLFEAFLFGVVRFQNKLLTFFWGCLSFRRCDSTPDGARRLLEWKTASARYLDQPERLTSLDLQLVLVFRITGIPDVAIVAFVRKRVPKIQYL